MGGQHNCNPSLNDVHNSSFSDWTDTPQAPDNCINRDLTDLKTVNRSTESHIQDQTSNNDTNSPDNPDLETTEIVHVGTKDDCSILIKIGDRNHKALWDSGAGKCVISYDKYKTIPEKLKTQLSPSKIMIKAANGSTIEKKGECDITFKIGPARFTFTFLVSNELTQDVILGYNFSKAYHIGTDWNKNDEMILTMNGQQLTTTISTKAINALVQCAESISIPPRSNAMIKCKAPKAMCHQNYGRICVFEPSSRHTSDNASCHTYNGTVVIDDDVKTFRHI